MTTIINSATTLMLKSSALDGRRRSQSALVQVNTDTNWQKGLSDSAVQLGDGSTAQAVKTLLLTLKVVQVLTIIIINSATIRRLKSSALNVTIKSQMDQVQVNTVMSKLMAQ